MRRIYNLFKCCRSWVQRNLYSLSFFWLKPLFMVIVAVVAIIVSAITGKQVMLHLILYVSYVTMYEPGFRDSKTVEKRLVHPIIRKCVSLKEDPIECFPEEGQEMTIRKMSLNHDAIRLPAPQEVL